MFKVEGKEDWSALTSLPRSGLVGLPPFAVPTPSTTIAPEKNRPLGTLPPFFWESAGGTASNDVLVDLRHLHPAAGA